MATSMDYREITGRNIPCQSDVGAAEWDRLEATANAKDERIDDIIERCLENEGDWLVMEDRLVTSGDMSSILGEIRRHATVSESSGISLLNSGQRIVDSFANAMVDLVEDDFDYFDNLISDDKDI